MGKLADLIHREAKAREQSELDDILGGGGGPQHGGALEKLTGPGREATAAAEVSAMRDELERDPGLVDTGSGTAYLFGKYPSIPDSKMWDLIGKVRAELHPRAVGEDSPEPEGTEFVRFRR